MSSTRFSAPRLNRMRRVMQGYVAAGLVSTAGDLLDFGEMMLGGGERGGTRILSRPFVVLMTTN